MVPSKVKKCTIKIFIGGQGWWMLKGANSERGLKWGGGEGHSGILPKTSLNRSREKTKIVHREEGS